MKHEVIQPPDWLPPKGYSNGILARGGATLYVAGQIGWDPGQVLVGEGNLGIQFAQCLRNVVAVVKAAGGHPRQVVRMTIYVTDKKAYLADTKFIGTAWRESFGQHYPAMTLVEVADLLEEGAMVEIEATAVLP